jgi:tripartite ATP-independent transporter DctM subunit
MERTDGATASWSESEHVEAHGVGEDLVSPTGAATRAVAYVAALVLLGITLIPLIEILGRKLLHRSIVPGASGYAEHLTLWVAFLGGMLASRYGRHLSLSTSAFFKPGLLRFTADVVSSAATVLVCLALAWGTYGHVRNEHSFLETLGGGVPRWIASVIMPVGYLGVAMWAWARTPGRHGRWAALALVAAGLGIWLLGLRGPALVVPGLFALLAATLLGAPLFAIMGGLAALFFQAQGEPMTAIAIETYGLATMPLLPTLPLFALAGTVLAAGGASHRLLAFFRALLGWAPAGTAVAAVVACAFFTAITGASGVTILALGGLLLPILAGEGYSRRFSIGLLTASGSIGLLFPPSLPVILYGIRAQQPIEDLFKAGLIPGLLVVAAVAIYSAMMGKKGGVRRTGFDAKKLRDAVWLAKWDLCLPVFVLAALLTGVATLVEAAALTALYAILIEVVVHRTITLRRDLIRVLMETAILMGALLFILGSALGLTGYMVGAEIPSRLVEWMQTSVHSPFVFLLFLNLLLLVTGMLLDIFSAIIIVVPLILPLGEAFHINPLHLGIIFLANLELGYLTPPVGLNLFLSSLRFNVPMGKVFTMVIPFVLLFAIWVLLITYVPFLTTAL